MKSSCPCNSLNYYSQQISSEISQAFPDGKSNLPGSDDSTREAHEYKHRHRPMGKFTFRSISPNLREMVKFLLMSFL